MRRSIQEVAAWLILNFQMLVIRILNRLTDAHANCRRGQSRASI